jgi:6-phosphogluconate dehydrogenase (decarboxylating)
MLKPSGIHYLDAGTSGGVWGLERGYCMMIGGDRSCRATAGSIFATLAPGTGEIPKNTWPRIGRAYLRRHIRAPTSALAWLSLWAWL